MRKQVPFGELQFKDNFYYAGILSVKIGYSNDSKDNAAQYNEGQYRLFRLNYTDIVEVDLQDTFDNIPIGGYFKITSATCNQVYQKISGYTYIKASDIIYALADFRKNAIVKQV